MSMQFGSDNLLENATLTMLTGDENLQFPLSNLKVPLTSKTFRVTGSTVEFIIDTGSFLPVDTFMLVGDNIEGVGVNTVKIYGSPTLGFGASTEIEIDISDENNFGFKQFTEVNHRYWKVVLTGSVYCELSNIFLGKAVSFNTNAFQLGSFKYLDRENLDLKKNKYKNIFINTYNSQKSLVGNISVLNTTEYQTIREIFNDNRRSKPLWFILDPDDFLETDSKYIYSGFFYLNNDTQFSNTNSRIWSTVMSLSEVV